MANRLKSHHLQGDKKMTKLTAQNWRKEWLKRFKGSSCKHCPKDSLDFIQSILQAQAKDLAGEIKKNVTSSEFSYIDGYGQMRLNIPKFLSFIEEVLEKEGSG